MTIEKLFDSLYDSINLINLINLSCSLQKINSLKIF